MIERHETSGVHWQRATESGEVVPRETIDANGEGSDCAVRSGANLDGRA